MKNEKERLQEQIDKLKREEEAKKAKLKEERLKKDADRFSSFSVPLNVYLALTKAKFPFHGRYIQRIKPLF